MQGFLRLHKLGLVAGPGLLFFGAQPHQAMVLGQCVQPAFEIPHLVALEFYQQLFKNEDDAVLRVLGLPQVFQANTIDQLHIPLEETAQHRRVGRCLKGCHQIFIGGGAGRYILQESQWSNVRIKFFARRVCNFFNSCISVKTFVMKKMTIFLGSLLLVALTALCFRDSFSVRGKVIDDQGQPVAGANVRETGTINGTVTNADGQFVLNVRSPQSNLDVSAVGYTTTRVPIKGRDSVQITLNINRAQLDEVVVTGVSRNYYSTALQGKASGLVVTSGSAPLRIRGTSSMFANGNGNGNGYAGGQTTDSINTEEYDHIEENPFRRATDEPLSTFSIDVDAASYSNVRRFLNENQMPPADAVRIEEMVNYFHYDYPQPDAGQPFSINTEIGACPWNNKHQLVLIGLQGRKVPMDQLPASNLVFLIDVSGSMDEPEKLPLVQSSLRLLTDQLREQDRISIVVYAGNAGLVLPPTSGANKMKIKEAISSLQAGGSTAGGEGILLAYKTAEENFMKNGNNRIILCTDGDFNVGVSSNGALERLVEEKRKTGVFLTVLGFGMGNYKDSKMEVLADKGDGNHAYIDGEQEAKKVLVSEFGGTLFTIAKDVKLQVEFNPAQVQGYRLIGYENRMLNKEDFNDDKKDAGELGSGHTVTALYEIIPAGITDTMLRSVDPLKYQKPVKVSKTGGDEWLTVKFRYKAPNGATSQLIEHPLAYKGQTTLSDNFRFASAVAEFGLLLRGSSFKAQASYQQVLRAANGARGQDTEGYRKEFLTLVKKAARLEPLQDEEE